ncbi:MAG: type II toxin-antitoxin system HicB family antitoxin [Candidatus Roizmanbacteria bacterium]|nr:type II toxin-antitoxin system HicB family antitoxin [Candidatus Roizmanbacteria bacterium]
MKTNKTITLSEFELPVTIQADETGGFIATSPVWSDCYAQGDTVEEALQEITAVAASLIELYDEEGMKVPLTKKSQWKKSLGGFDLQLPVIVSYP